MTNTDKILEEFALRTVQLGDELKSFLTDSITQAIAEERERVRGEMEKAIAEMKEEVVSDNFRDGYNQALDDLKPIISNILK